MYVNAVEQKGPQPYTDNKQPLLEEFNFLEASDIEDSPPTSSWIPWLKRGVTLLGLGGSVALRVASLSLSTNAIASIGIGFTACHVITSLVPNEETITMARIRQFALPIIGQTSTYFLSQAWANVSGRGEQIAFDNTIIALLGVNAHLILNWLWQQGAIRNESQAPIGKTAPDRKLDKKPIVPLLWSRVAKVFASAGLTYLYTQTEDTILKPVSAFFASFLAAQAFGEAGIDFVDHQVHAHDRGEGTRWRTFKTALLTISWIGRHPAFALLPWRNSKGSERLFQLWLAGGLLGTFDGILTRSQNRRIEKIDVNDLEELMKQPLPERSGGCCNLFKYQVCRIWKYGASLISLAGLIGFTSWQVSSVLTEKEEKIGLYLTLAGFTAATSICHLVDRSWDPKKAHFYRDKLMGSIWYSHRFFFVDPIYFYFALINAVKIDSDALGSETSDYRIAALSTAWFFYGGRWAHELFISSSDRYGDAQIKYPTMAMLDGVKSASYYILGKN